MFDERKTPKIIFICSAGHSGSTLLDKMIGATQNSISLGEIRQWNKYFTKDGTHPIQSHEKQQFDTCTCGANLDNNECGFWNMIKNKHEYTITLPRDTMLKRKIAEYIVSLKTISDIAPENDDYLNLIYKLQDITGHDTFIDSSKSIQWLLMLANYHKKGYIQLYVIQLSRRPEGVYYSNKKIQRNPKREMIMRNFMHRIRRNIVSGEELPNIIITYEELAQKPSETMKKLQFKTGLDFNNWQEEINKKKYHLIGGNPKRFEQTTIIQEDTKWRYELSTIEKMCSRLLSIY